MKVRITSFARSDESFYKNLIPKYAFGKQSWKDIEFVYDNSYDWLVILTSPNKKTIEDDYDYKRAITFLTEPPESRMRIAYPTSLVSPMYFPQPYWRTTILDEIKKYSNNEYKKEKLLSTVTSGLNGLIGHNFRLNFINFFDNIIEDGFDIWGRDHGNPIFRKLQHYKGSLLEKYDALWNYEYHFACENTFHKGYFTEKIIDPIMCDCVCFYDGCLNIEDFIDHRVFIKVDVTNISQTTQAIINAIEENQWQKRIQLIRKQKERFLYHLNPLNLIWMTLQGKDILKECKL